MWPFGMTWQEMADFLRENSETFIEIMLKAYGYTVDEIVVNHMADEAEAFTGRGDYWEAC